MKKYNNSHPGSEPRTPVTVVSIMTLDHQSQIHIVSTKLFMVRSQLREKSAKQVKVTGMNESLLVLELILICGIGYNEFDFFLENKENRPFDGCKIEI